MIRFAPAAAPAGTITPIKAAAHTSTATKTKVETPAIETRKVIDERKPDGEGELLLAELPEVSAPTTKAAKARSPRKSKIKLESATAAQLDLSA